MPWRKTRDPYRILVSEIMLQQTQVSRVGPFYRNFIKKFPDFRALAAAKTVDVLKAWQGLGYNRRAIALQNLSRIVLEKFNDRLPDDRDDLESLPGIGPGTSGSLMAFAFNKPVVFIETNIRRVFIHHFFKNRADVTDAEIERCIERTMSRRRAREWYWALMDYGSWLATGDARLANPNRRSAHYAKQKKFKGSDRELRGRILKLLVGARGASSAKAIARTLNEAPIRVRGAADALVREGFLAKMEQNESAYCIKE